MMYLWDNMSTKELTTYAILIVASLSAVSCATYSLFWAPDVLTNGQIIAQNIKANSDMLSKFRVSSLRTDNLLDPALGVIETLLEHHRIIELDLSDLQLNTIGIRMCDPMPHETKIELMNKINDSFYIISELHFRQVSLLLEQGASYDRVVKLREIKRKFMYVTNENLQEALVIASGPVLTLVEFINYRVSLSCNLLFLNYSYICNPTNDYYVWQFILKNFNFDIYNKQILDYRIWLNNNYLTNALGGISELVFAINELQFYSNFLFDKHYIPNKLILSGELFDFILDLNRNVKSEVAILPLENLRLMDEIAANNRIYDALMLDIFKK